MLGQRGEAAGRRVARVMLGITFIGAGTLHFVRPRWYEAIMPPWVPWHRELVYASGVAEIAGALGVLVPREDVQRYAGWWLVATLLAVFPANVHMALNPEDYKKVSPALLYGRLPVQGAFIAWALLATKPEPRRRLRR